jgi:alkylation response protein AidB-like acyl-CoA dehydrogenase
MRFDPVALDDDERRLQQEVQAFLDEELPFGSYEPGLGMAAEHDPEFSRKLAQRGWLGMTIPREYGGQGRTAVHRFLVTEILLARGTPVGAHWVADRQSAPAILRHGTPEQRARFLPAICRGESYFSIGMSEPDSGSDLASIRTRATQVDGGWLVNGTKTWTSMAHRNHWFFVLCRTSQEEDKRHGLSQLIVDLSAPGVEIRPIPLINGHHHFNEVALTDVFVPDDLVLGEIGQGWRQVTGELAHERSGPDRYLSTYLLLEQLVRASLANAGSPRTAEVVGRLAARLWGLRQMSLSVARALDGDREPAVEASVVKDLGTVFEREVIDLVREVVEIEPDSGSPSLFARLLAESVLTAPTFTIRGGTTEILRSIISRSLVAA